MADPDPVADPDLSGSDPDLSGSVPAARPFFGRVTSFDARRGLGTVTDTEGSVFEFHATAIVDGSRRIDPGTEVSFVVAQGHRGRYQARALTAVGSPVMGSTSHHLPA
jgi:cold shock CspA family protein